MIATLQRPTRAMFLIGLIAGLPAAAAAQSVEQFYCGRTVTHRGRDVAGRHQRYFVPPGGQASRPLHSRQSEHHRPERAGRRRPRTALGTTLSASAQLRVSSGGVAMSTTEIGTERAMRAAILPGRAGAIRVTSG